MTFKNIKKIYRKMMRPPRVATDTLEQTYVRKITEEWREIVLIDVIIISFLIASAHQLAYFFEGGSPGVFSWVKALGFDGAIALFSRHVSRAKVLGEKSKGVWSVLIILMLITVFCNVGYEWLKETGGIGLRYVVHDPVKNLKALVTSGSLAIIILGISAVRATVMKSFEDRQHKYKRQSTDLSKKEQRNEKDRRRRAAKLEQEAANELREIAGAGQVVTGENNYKRGRVNQDRS